MGPQDKRRRYGSGAQEDHTHRANIKQPRRAVLCFELALWDLRLRFFFFLIFIFLLGSILFFSLRSFRSGFVRRGLSSALIVAELTILILVPIEGSYQVLVKIFHMMRSGNLLPCGPSRRRSPGTRDRATSRYD